MGLFTPKYPKGAEPPRRNRSKREKSRDIADLYAVQDWGRARDSSEDEERDARVIIYDTFYRP